LRFNKHGIAKTFKFESLSIRQIFLTQQMVIQWQNKLNALESLYDDYEPKTYTTAS